MSLMTAIEVGASGLTAQRRRIEVGINNLVNASTTAPPGQEPFRRKSVVFSATGPEVSFGSSLGNALDGVSGVEVSQVVTDQSDPIPVYDPGHPHADKDGLVYYPNIDPMEEMVDLVWATRSYEANLQAVTTTKEMALKTLDILR